MKRTIMLWSFVAAIVAGLGFAFGLRVFGGALVMGGVVGVALLLAEEVRVGRTGA